MNNMKKLALGSVLAVLLLSAMPVARAQDGDVLDKIVPTLDYEQIDVRDALKALFRIVNANYTVDQDVQGQVTLSLKNVKFGTVLENITRQVDATYRIEGGIFRILKKEEVAAGTQTNPEVDPNKKPSEKPVRRIKILHADPMFIAMLIGGTGNQQYGNSHPEMSQMQYMRGGGGSGGGSGGGFGGGSGGGFGGSSGGGFGGGSSGGGFGGGSGGGFGGGSGGGFGGGRGGG